jgi:hypothetical protein
MLVLSIPVSTVVLSFNLVQLRLLNRLPGVGATQGTGIAETYAKNPLAKRRNTSTKMGPFKAVFHTDLDPE